MINDILSLDPQQNLRAYFMAHSLEVQPLMRELVTHDVLDCDLSDTRAEMRRKRAKEETKKKSKVMIV